MENMDQIIMVVRNWSYDSWLHWMPNTYLKDYMKNQRIDFSLMSPCERVVGLSPRAAAPRGRCRAHTAMKRLQSASNGIE